MPTGTPRADPTSVDEVICINRVHKFPAYSVHYTLGIYIASSHWGYALCSTPSHQLPHINWELLPLRPSMPLLQSVTRGGPAVCERGLRAVGLCICNRVRGVHDYPASCWSSPFACRVAYDAFEVASSL